MAINPFQQPINYTAQMVDLNPAFQGLGEAFRGLGESRQQQERLAQAQAAKQQFELDLQKAQTDGTQSAWTGMIARYPQFREAFGDVRKNIGEERVKGEFTQGFNWSTALENNRPDIVIQGLATTIQAKKNSGEPSDTHEQALELLESGEPIKIKQAQSILNGYLATLDPDRFEKSVKARQSLPLSEASLRTTIAAADAAESAAKTALATATNAPEKAAAEAALSKAQADKAKIDAQFAGSLAQASLNLNAAQIKNINSEISNRAAKLNLDKQTMQATVAEKLSTIQNNLNQMPADTRKLVNESAVTAAASKQSADQFNDLAKRIDSAGGNYGVASSASDFLKKVGGFQGGMTQLKQEYTRLRNTAAIKSLPPGPATDKDIQMALSGFPSDTANAGDLARFLRGMAKLQDVDASISNAKTDWLAQNNGTLTRAKNTFVAGDYATKPGETFNDFSQRIIGDVSKKYRSPEQIAEEKRQQSIAQIPTKGTPAPTQQVDVRSQADAILRGGQ